MVERLPLRAMLLGGMLLVAAPVAARPAAPPYDLIIRGGTLYDGSGAPPVTGDVAWRVFDSTFKPLTAGVGASSTISVPSGGFVAFFGGPGSAVTAACCCPLSSRA